MTEAAPSDATPSSDDGLRRVFFALWPDDAMRGALERATRDAVQLAGGRQTAKRNYHLTVAFLGMADAEALAVIETVPPVQVGAFEVRLDELGHFAGARALWVGPSAVPPALAALERRLWGRLEAAGLEREERPYRPHVTLARRARPVDLAVEPVIWRFERLSLVESRHVPPHGVHYEPLRDWPL